MTPIEAFVNENIALLQVRYSLCGDMKKSIDSIKVNFEDVPPPLNQLLFLTTLRQTLEVMLKWDIGKEEREKINKDVIDEMTEGFPANFTFINNNPEETKNS